MCKVLTGAVAGIFVGVFALELFRRLPPGTFSPLAAGLNKKAANAAREALDLAKLRFTAGLATQLDVASAQANLAQAEEDEIRSRYDGLVAEARLAQAGGDVRRFAQGR